MAGQENYLELSQEGYFDKFEKDVLVNADLYYLNKKFGVGKELDRDKLKHSQMFYNILCTDECELIDWVFKKINGDIEDCNHKIKIGDFRIYDMPYGIDHLNTTINGYCNWEKVEW